MIETLEQCQEIQNLHKTMKVSNETYVFAFLLMSKHVFQRGPSFTEVTPCHEFWKPLMKIEPRIGIYIKEY